MIYDSFHTIPIFNFKEIYETNDLRFLYKNSDLRKSVLTDSDKDKLSKVFSEILLEQNEISIPKHKILEIKLFLNELKYEFEQKSNIKNEILLLQKQIDIELKKISETKNNTWNLDDEITHISKFVGFFLDKMTVSAASFFSYRKAFKEYIESQKNTNVKK